jgi:ABC-type sugar transport system substrate-binding protein
MRRRSQSPRSRLITHVSHQPISAIATLAIAIALLAFALLPLISCKKDDQSDYRLSKRGFVAIVGVGEDDPVWPVLRASARRLHGELATPIPLRDAAPTHRSANAQRQLLSKLAGEGLAAVAVQVTDPEALAPELNALASRGIRVVTIGQKTPRDPPYIHCGLDNDAIGTSLANALAERIAGKGTIAVLHADDSDPASRDRRRAFDDQLATHIGLQAILEFDCNGSPTEARTIIRDTMNRFPRLSGWAVMGNWPLVDHDGKRILPDGCVMVGVGPFANTWDAIDDANVHAMIASRYDELARHALTTCLSHVVGRSQLPIDVKAPVEVVYRSTLTEFKRQWLRWQSDTPELTP